MDIELIDLYCFTDPKIRFVIEAKGQVDKKVALGSIRCEKYSSTQDLSHEIVK